MFPLVVLMTTGCRPSSFQAICSRAASGDRLLTAATRGLLEQRHRCRARARNRMPGERDIDLVTIESPPARSSRRMRRVVAPVACSNAVRTSPAHGSGKAHENPIRRSRSPPGSRRSPGPSRAGAPGTGLEGTPHLGQVDRTGSALEELDVQDSFELLDGACESGLGDEQSPARNGEGPALRYGGEGTQVPQLHIHNRRV